MAERNIRETKQWIRTGRILTEALPYLQHYRGTCFVVKYGGHAMGDERLARDFANDIVLLTIGGIQPIVVHGGGPQIGEMLSRLKIKSEFVDGLRVTDKATVGIVEMVLSGSINKQVVHALTRSGGRAVGLSGKDGGLLRARKLRRTQRDPDSNIEKLLDLGFVGEPDRVDPDIIHALVEAGITPVIAPIGAGDQGETYNINADTAAGAIAGAIGAERLFLLTDVAGVLDKEGRLIAEMTVSEAQARMADGTITGGMIPKVQTCVDAIRANTEAAVILDGRVPHAILLEIFTNRGVGTLIRPD